MRRRVPIAVLRKPALVATALAGVLLGAGAALAASLSVTSTKLTVHTPVSSVPPTACTLSAADADSYVSQAQPNSNFGTDANLHVRSLSLANRRTFLQFSLAPCSIPANSLITAASLRLYMYAAPSASRTYDAHRVTASWTETGIDWNNEPAVAGSPTSSVATGTTSDVTLAWDVTADVQAFVDGTTNNGWRIKDDTDGALVSRLAEFRSAEYGTASERPVLEITYYP
jgi:hypothetical protein